MIAARTIIKAKKKRDFGLEALWGYNAGWFTGEGNGAHLAALGALKEILQGLSHEEISFLIRQDILSGEMLTPAINGVFAAPDAKTMMHTLKRGISRPAVLMKLNRATRAGSKIFRHYMNYPKAWDARSFAAWQSRAEAYFRGI